MSGFEEFTEAVDQLRNQSHVPVADTPFTSVAVLGGGSDARLVAALCVATNIDVALFSAYGHELDALHASSGITLRGAGPVGTYQIDNEQVPSVKTSAELDRVVANAEAIFLTGPVHKQRTYAMVLADHLHDGQVLVLAPGRTLGALETAWLLRIGGCTADITIVETQGLPYWIATEGSVLHLSEAAHFTAATLPSGRVDVLSRLRNLLFNLQPADSVLESGFADGSALVELPTLLIGGPAVATNEARIPIGATPLPENYTFASLIGDGHRQVINRLAEERRRVARHFGIRNLPTADEWIANHAGEHRGDDARPVPPPTETSTLLRDGVIGSLVPLLSAARLTSESVPTTEAVITLASAVLGADVAAAGRRLDTIGISGDDVESARRAMDAIATGAR